MIKINIIYDISLDYHAVSVSPNDDFVPHGNCHQKMELNRSERSKQEMCTRAYKRTSSPYLFSSISSFMVFHDYTTMVQLGM